MNFFRRVEIQPRNRLVVALDFQNLGVSAKDIPKLDYFIMDKLDRIAPQADQRILKVFARPDQQAAVIELKKLKWRPKEDTTNLDEAIILQCKADCGQNPNDTTLVICSKDGDFAKLIQEMQDWGVEVHLLGPHDVSQRLKDAVGSRKWEDWPLWAPSNSDYIEGQAQ